MMKLTLKLSFILCSLFLNVTVISGVNTEYRKIKLSYSKDRVSESTENMFLKGVEYILSFYNMVSLPLDRYNISVRVFNTFEEYKTYQRENSTARSNNGYYSNSRYEMVLFNNDKIVKTFYHEFNHYILRSILSSPPKWINEGLSEYFEYLKINDNNDCYLTTQMHKIKRVKDWIKEDNDFVERVLTISNKQWSAENYKPDYRSSSTSYAIIYYLMSREDGKEIIKEIFKKLMNGESSKGSIETTYRGGYKKFISEFNTYYSAFNTDL